RKAGFVEDEEMMRRAQRHPMAAKNHWEIFAFRKV
ncbi:unnamed protein product, partial [marine sediment metagenome]